MPIGGQLSIIDHVFSKEKSAPLLVITNHYAHTKINPVVRRLQGYHKHITRNV